MLCLWWINVRKYIRMGIIIIRNVHLRRYIIGYMVENFVLWLCWHIAVKRNFQSFKWRYTSPNEHFEYSYPLSVCLGHGDECITAPSLPLADQVLKEQSDMGLHCLPFHLHLLDAFYNVCHLLDALIYGKTILFKFKGVFLVSEFVQFYWRQHILFLLTVHLLLELIDSKFLLFQYWKPVAQNRLHFPLEQAFCWIIHYA